MTKITTRKGYLASYYFLDWIYLSVKKNDGNIAQLLGDMNPFFPWKDAMSADPGTWFEWLDCADSVTPGVKANAAPENFQIHPDAAYETLKTFLMLYDDRDLYHTKWLIKALKKDPAMREKWNEFLSKQIAD